MSSTFRKLEKDFEKRELELWGSGNKEKFRKARVCSSQRVSSVFGLEGEREEAVSAKALCIQLVSLWRGSENGW